MILVMFDAPDLLKPGLFVTGTDTGVGKTVVSCAIAGALRRQRQGARVGVCKPMSTGCRKEREGLVHEDAEALAWAADCRLPLDVVNPIRFRMPLAPAVAAELEKHDIEWDALSRAMRRLDEASDVVVVEGVGGLMVPLDPRDPRYTVRELAAAMGYPVVVVCRSVLGTLNHTAMTVELLRQAGLQVAGLIMNGLDTDAAAGEADPSIKSNREWLERTTGAKVLAVVPKAASGVEQDGVMDTSIVNAVASVNWWKIVKVTGLK